MRDVYQERVAGAREESALARRLRGRKATQPDELPGVVGKFVWRLVLESEKQECTAKALRRLESLKIPHDLQRWQDLESEIMTQVLARAMRDPDQPGEDESYPYAIARDADELRDLLTADERDILWKRYADWEADQAPIEAELSTLMTDAITRAVKKKDAADLNAFAPAMLRQWLLSMGSQLLNSP